MTLQAELRAKAETSRFERKRSDILNAAAALINEKGVKGMTFTEVAGRVGLNTTSVTYYFRRKEQLAAAAYADTLDRIEAMAAEAAAEPDPAARATRWLADNIDLRRRIRLREERRLAILSEIRTLDDDFRIPLQGRYQQVFDVIRGFFGNSEEPRRRALDAARAQLLLECTFWLPAWITRYSLDDFPRIQRRIADIVLNGFVTPGAKWAPQPIAALLPQHRVAEEGAGDRTRDEFLRVATVLINERGYRGASVDRIAAELNVTKGSFYHHLDAKDDLVFECFRRSYDGVSAVQHAALDMDGDYWLRLSSALSTLIDRQFHAPLPMMRTTALQAMPIDERGNVVERSNRLALRFAGMLIDGIAEGSIRAVDPLIASQVIMSTLNAGYEMRDWASQAETPEEAVRRYATPLCYGVLAEPVSAS